MNSMSYCTLVTDEKLQYAMEVMDRWIIYGSTDGHDIQEFEKCRELLADYYEITAGEKPFVEDLKSESKYLKKIIGERNIKTTWLNSNSIICNVCEIKHYKNLLKDFNYHKYDREGYFLESKLETYNNNDFFYIYEKLKFAEEVLDLWNKTNGKKEKVEQALMVTEKMNDVFSVGERFLDDLLINSDDREGPIVILDLMNLKPKEIYEPVEEVKIMEMDMLGN